MMIRLGTITCSSAFSLERCFSSASYIWEDDMVPPVTSLGQTAFQAYAEAQGNLTYDKKKIPTWDKIGADIQAAWEAAAVAAVNASATLSNHARRDILGG